MPSDLALCLAGDEEACARLSEGSSDTGKSAVGQRFVDDQGNTYTLVDKGAEPQYQRGQSLEGYQSTLKLWRNLPQRYFRGATGTTLPLTAGEYTSSLGKTYSLDETGKILGSRVLPGSSSRDAQAKALDEAQAERLRQQTLIDEQQLELQRQAAQETRRQNLLQAALSLTNTQTQERQNARNQSVQLAGTDPFRFLAQIHQQAVGDVQTPYDIFKGYLGQTATQPIPQVNANSSIQDLESAVGKLQQAQQQSQNAPTSAYGFATGGSLPAGSLQARLVGEQGSQIAPGTEVMITGNGQTTVLPLGPGFQQGGALSDASLTVLPDLFRNLRMDITGGQPGSYTRLGYLEPGQATQGTNARFGRGYGALAEPLSLRPGYQDLVKSGIISQPDADRIVGLIGLLPSPRAAAAALRNLTPGEQSSLLSAYRLAGIPDEDFKALVASATLEGPRRTGISLAA